LTHSLAPVVLTSLAPRGNLDDPLSRLYLPFLQHSKVESRFSARGQQSGHLGLVHPDTHAVACDSRLRHFEYGLPNVVSVADAYLVVRHPLNGEVLAALSVCETPSTYPTPPIPVRLDLIAKVRALLASVASETSLSVAVNVEPPDHAPAFDRFLPDRRMNHLPPPCDVARKADVNRQKSRHQS